MDRHAGDVLYPVHPQGRTHSTFSFPARAAWLTVPAAAVFLLLAGLIYIEPPLYRAEAQVLLGPATAGLIGLRSSLVQGQKRGRLDMAQGQAQLIASRDLARRAIQDLNINAYPEFDKRLQVRGPLAGILIFLGLTHDPFLYSSEDRVLEAYQKSLHIEAQSGTNFVTIAFQSEDRELAARAANRIAELYLEMRRDLRRAAGLQLRNDGAIVTRATPPLRPIHPDNRLMLLSAAATFALAGIGLTLTSHSKRPRTSKLSKPPCSPERPHRLMARLTTHHSPAHEPSLQAYARSASSDVDFSGYGAAIDKLLNRIKPSPRPDPAAVQMSCGTKILVTSLGLPQKLSILTWALAHRLSPAGSSIVIELNPSSSFDSIRPDCPQEPGLRELLAGTASFTEVIHRDPASRLHILGAGSEGRLDICEVRAAVDTLAETYNFLLVQAPPLDQNDTAAALASSADFVVLALPAGLKGSRLIETQTRLLEAGAGDVLPISEVHPLPHNIGQNAA
ncbi:MAG TPA: hypothetical protein VME69_08430 [Methylocella sp.]|nr:hypothetical protein [Methylocella sp.]